MIGFRLPKTGMQSLRSCMRPALTHGQASLCCTLRTLTTSFEHLATPCFLCKHASLHI